MTSEKSIPIKDRDYASKLKTVVQSEVISGCPEKREKKNDLFSPIFRS